MRSYPLKRRRRWLWLSLWLFCLVLHLGSFIYGWEWAVAEYSEEYGLTYNAYAVSLYSGYLKIYAPGDSFEDDTRSFPGELHYVNPLPNDGSVRSLPRRFAHSCARLPVIEGERNWEYEIEPGVVEHAAALMHWWCIGVPLWMLVLGLSLPTAYYFLWLPRRFSKAGVCRVCGYNLTGNTSGTCPECGASIPDEA